MQFDEQLYLKEHPDVAAAIKDGNFSTGLEHYEKFGRVEGREFPSLNSRQAAIFHMIDREGLGLEIGPSYSPLAPKRKGFNVQTVDHATVEELRIKYQGHGVDVDAIEEIDFLWDGQPLSELIGRKNCYDWIIASHVIEHIPDLVSFLQECEALLKPDGVLSLAIPDKRYCFDYFQPITYTGALLDAFLQKRTKPSGGQIFDHFANAAKQDSVILWESGPADSLAHDFAGAREFWERSNAADEYIDVHCWKFTPDSFELLISDLSGLNLIRLQIVAQFPTQSYEFFVTLAKGPTDTSPDRLGRLNSLLGN